MLDIIAEQPRRIVYLEDSEDEAQKVQEFLGTQFPGVEIYYFGTESEFRDGMQLLRRNPPDIAILDMMVAWTRPAPEMPSPPEDVINEGFYTAGLRCRNLLSENPATAKISAIIYSCIDEIDFQGLFPVKPVPPDTHFLHKTGTPEPLIAKIREVLRVTT